MRVTNATWVWSDTHFGHKNIVKFQQRPETHEVIMLSNWSERVRDDHTILHLGDVLMGRQGNPKRWAMVLGRMPGRKFVVQGNHDDDDDLRLLERYAGFEVVEPFVWAEKGVAFTHRPITSLYGGQPEWDLVGATAPVLEAWHTNVHGHVHQNAHHPNAGELVPGRRYVNVCVECTGLAPVQIGSLL